jgi:hypothetical protein
MSAIPWKRRRKTVNGRLLQWAIQDLAGGCRLISVQNMDESHEKRFPPEDSFAPLAKRKRRESFHNGASHAVH